MVPWCHYRTEVGKAQNFRSLESGTQKLRAASLVRRKPGGTKVALEHKVGMQLISVPSLLIAFPAFGRASCEALDRENADFLAQLEIGFAVLPALESACALRKQT